MLIEGIWTDGGWLWGVLVAAGVVLLIILLMRVLGGDVKRESRGVRDARNPSVNGQSELPMGGLGSSDRCNT